MSHTSLNIASILFHVGHSIRNLSLYFNRCQSAHQELKKKNNKKNEMFVTKIIN